MSCGYCMDEAVLFAHIHMVSIYVHESESGYSLKGIHVDVNPFLIRSGDGKSAHGHRLFFFFSITHSSPLSTPTTLSTMTKATKVFFDIAVNQKPGTCLPCSYCQMIHFSPFFSRSLHSDSTTITTRESECKKNADPDPLKSLNASFALHTVLF